MPANEQQLKIPRSRVNHNKYMVTDKTAYIGTSNWSGDYFTTTAGIGISLLYDSKVDVQKTGYANSSLRNDLVNIFHRDWNSPYAVDHDLRMVDTLSTIT